MPGALGPSNVINKFNLTPLWWCWVLDWRALLVIADEVMMGSMNVLHLFLDCFPAQQPRNGKWNSRNYSRVLFYHFLSCLFSTSFAYIFRWFSCTSHCQWAQFARITQPRAVKSNKQLEMTGFTGSQLQFRANFFLSYHERYQKIQRHRKSTRERQTHDSNDSRGILNSYAARVWRSPDAYSSENLSADWHTRRRTRKAHMKPSVAQCAWLFTPFDEARKREWISDGKSWMRSNWDQRAGPRQIVDTWGWI